MADPARPRISFAEWLHGGIVVHFERGETVFYPARFLYEQRHDPATRLFPSDGSSSQQADGASQPSGEQHPPPSESER